MNLRERLLGHTAVYKSFKNIVSPPKLVERTVDKYLQVHDGASVLDLGCGYGDMARFYVGRARYVGIDSNESYIAEARQRNVDNDAEFIVGDIFGPCGARPWTFRSCADDGRAAPPAVRARAINRRGIHPSRRRRRQNGRYRTGVCSGPASHCQTDHRIGPRPIRARRRRLHRTASRGVPGGPRNGRARTTPYPLQPRRS